MRRYETIYIIRPTANEDDITTIIDRTNAVIEQAGGTIINLDRWGLRKLAYLIKKESQGYYVFTEYASSPTAVDEIERLFRIDENTLKYMTIKIQDTYIPDAPKAEVEAETAPAAEAENQEASKTVAEAADPA
ncbi:MAG TPA: 30S ribosomal protein S6 [Desulfobacterales bacterium]|nr:30S ribosomal protein S6 [Desulfobacterales bacterium]